METPFAFPYQQQRHQSPQPAVSSLSIQHPPAQAQAAQPQPQPQRQFQPHHNNPNQDNQGSSSSNGSVRPPNVTQGEFEESRTINHLVESRQAWAWNHLLSRDKHDLVIHMMRIITEGGALHLEVACAQATANALAGFNLVLNLPVQASARGELTPTFLDTFAIFEAWHLFCRELNLVTFPVSAPLVAIYLTRVPPLARAQTVAVLDRYRAATSALFHVELPAQVGLRWDNTRTTLWRLLVTEGQQRLMDWKCIRDLTVGSASSLIFSTAAQNQNQPPPQNQPQHNPSAIALGKRSTHDDNSNATIKPKPKRVRTNAVRLSKEEEAWERGFSDASRELEDAIDELAWLRRGEDAQTQHTSTSFASDAPSTSARPQSQLQAPATSSSSAPQRNIPPWPNFGLPGGPQQLSDSNTTPQTVPPASQPQRPLSLVARSLGPPGPASDLTSRLLSNHTLKQADKQVTASVDRRRTSVGPFSFAPAAVMARNSGEVQGRNSSSSLGVPRSSASITTSTSSSPSSTAVAAAMLAQPKASLLAPRASIGPFTSHRKSLDSEAVSTLTHNTSPKESIAKNLKPKATSSKTFLSTLRRSTFIGLEVPITHLLRRKSVLSGTSSSTGGPSKETTAGVRPKGRPSKKGKEKEKRKEIVPVDTSNFSRRALVGVSDKVTMASEPCKPFG